MLEGPIGRAADDYVEFHAAGTKAKGSYRCADCGYGITSHDKLPGCPRCASVVWELSEWTPFVNSGYGRTPGRAR